MLRDCWATAEQPLRNWAKASVQPKNVHLSFVLQYYSGSYMCNYCKTINKRNQLLFATGIERGIHNHRVLKYQPFVTSRLIFQYSMFNNGIKWWNITLDVTAGWYFRSWQSWMPRSMPVVKSNWVRLISYSSHRKLCYFIKILFQNRWKATH